MGALGCGCSGMAAAFALIATVPFLAWLNWITTLPAAITAIVLGIMGIAKDEYRGAGVLAVGGGILVLFWALFRLTIGGGFV